MLCGGPEQYLPTYLAEASKRLGMMEESVAALIDAPGAPVIDRLLLCAHTMKGMSAMMGYAGRYRRRARSQPRRDQGGRVPAPAR